LPSLLGDDYGSSSDEEDATTPAASIGNPSESIPVTSSEDSAPPRKKKRIRFAHSDLLVTTIHFDASLPIDPSVDADSEPEDDDLGDDEEAALAAIMAAAQEVDESPEDDNPTENSSFSGITLSARAPVGLEEVPAPMPVLANSPPPVAKPAAFSFAKSVTTVVAKKAQEPPPAASLGGSAPVEGGAVTASGGGGDGNGGGLWSMLQPRQVRISACVVARSSLTVAAHSAPLAKPLEIVIVLSIKLSHSTTSIHKKGQRSSFLLLLTLLTFLLRATFFGEVPSQSKLWTSDVLVQEHLFDCRFSLLSCWPFCAPKCSCRASSLLFSLNKPPLGCQVGGQASSHA
jgi:hypothetical protein